MPISADKILAGRMMPGRRPGIARAVNARDIKTLSRETHCKRPISRVGITG